MKQYIEKCLAGEHLSVSEASAALELVMTNQASDIQIAGLLIALRAKGESPDELVGFARTMRDRAVRITPADPDAIDMCGTGGDGMGTFNISTVASLVAAGAGVTVAKHGNRSVSSKCGSADLFAAFGVNIQSPPERMLECLETIRIGFLFAPLYHPAMKFAGKARVELGVRTIFNMLGPIINPAGVRKQVIGAYREDVAEMLAGALKKLDTTRACVLHSSDGMDEVTMAGETRVFDVSENGPLRSYSVNPSDFGLPKSSVEAVRGGTSEENKAIALSILRKERSAARDVVLANAAIGIYVAGKAGTLKEGVAKAAESIDSGNALQTLNRFIEMTNRT